jgi:hypothetical protein
MDCFDRQFAVLRQEIDDLKILLWGTTDEAERRLIWAYLCESFRESVQLIEQRFHPSASAQDGVLLERNVGDASRTGSGRAA